MIVFKNGCWQTDSDHPDDNWLEGSSDLEQPKFVIPGVGAVGIENTYLVTDNGLECLTPFPEEIAELL